MLRNLQVQIIFVIIALSLATTVDYKFTFPIVFRLQ